MPYVQPQPGVAVNDDRVIFEELRLKTSTTGKDRPGRLVIRDTTDSEFKVAGSNGSGILGYIARDPTKDAATDIAAAAWARIGHGPGVVVTLYAEADSAAITKGNPVQSGGNGTVRINTAGAPTAGDKIVGRAEETITAPSGTEKKIMVRLAI